MVDHLAQLRGVALDQRQARRQLQADIQKLYLENLSLKAGKPEAAKKAAKP